MSDVTDLKAEVLLLRQENAKLRDKHKELQEFAARLSWVLDINGTWSDPEWCDSDCMNEFKCRPTGDNVKVRCLAWARLKELGVVK